MELDVIDDMRFPGLIEEEPLGFGKRCDLGQRPIRERRRIRNDVLSIVGEDWSWGRTLLAISEMRVNTSRMSITPVIALRRLSSILRLAARSSSEAAFSVSSANR
jgi:hypothetical protein